MCLAIVHSKNKPLTVGYKVMTRHNNGDLTGEYRAMSKVRPLNRWLYSDGYGYESHILASDNISWYVNGWHIFRKKKVAMRYTARRGWRTSEDCVVVRVKVRRIVASGLDIMGNEVVVSKQILITGEVA